MTTYLDFIEIYLACTIFIIGTLFGSFFSLANYRIPRKKDIVFTRSFCPKCNHNLGFFDLIPVLSYIFHGGKCKYCKEKISPRYILLELSSGTFFLVTYLIFKLTPYFFVSIALYIYFVMLTGIHLNKQKMIKEEMGKLNMEKDSLNQKSGVFITEVVVAAVIFAIAVTTMYLTYRSSTAAVKDELYNSNVMLECTKNVEIALGLEYDTLTSFSANTIIDGINYNTKIEVEKYSNSTKKLEDYIKIIKATTICNSGDKTYSYNIETMKKRVSK